MLEILAEEMVTSKIQEAQIKMPIQKSTLFKVQDKQVGFKGLKHFDNNQGTPSKHS